jgi:hypothetical protein
MKICYLEGCEKRSVSRGLCDMHRTRLKRYGDPLFSIKSHASVEDRFWRQVRKTNNCWFWTGSPNGKGYGSINLGGRNKNTVFAHRFSYEIHKGPIPEGLVVMHSCDNPACVNPDHLSVGTHKDNTQDMVRKGRARGGSLKGEANCKALLTEEKVRYIRGSKDTHASLARELQVSAVLIGKIRRRQLWRHLD